MPFTLNELLNPDPATAPDSKPAESMDSTDPTSSAYFAPELFQAGTTASNPAESALAAIAQTATNALEAQISVTPTHLDVEMTDVSHVKQEPTDPSDLPTETAISPRPDVNSQEITHDDPSHAERSLSKDSAEKSTKQRKHPGKSKPDLNVNKSSVHSSKNEGQHTDRRYLCYFCNKLFTRRRSVRDHISKIHNTKTWEPVRSLEVVVEPLSGEPVEPLEDIIARGPPPPPPKPTKAERRDSPPRQDDPNEVPPEAENQEGIPPPVEVPKPEEPLPSSRESPTRSLQPVASLKKEPSLHGSRASSVESFASPAAVAGKKRPAPSESAKPASAALKKKGVAKPKPASASNKRQKLSDTEHSSTLARSPLRSPSATPSTTHLKPLPSSKLKTQTSAASVRSSPTPSSRAASVRSQSRSSSAAPTPESSNDDGEVFCICRKGDNHTWMIACDGGCDEWYHGNCVNIRERDGDLIDKYICPTCMKPGLHTTWKRMCRRKDCRKPARVTQDPPSKYCSDVCGRMFFVELVQRGDPAAQSSRDGQFLVESEKPKKVRKKWRRPDQGHNLPKTVVPLVNGDVAELLNDDSRLATPAYSEEEKSDYETDSSLDDDMLPNRGSALRAGEVRALVERCKTIDDWKNLGRKPDTPPRELDESEIKTSLLDHDELELTKIASIEAQIRELNEKNELLGAREGLLDLIKNRSANIADEVKKSNSKLKPCGFDPRLAWSDVEFARWYHRVGKSILAAGEKAKIGPPDDDDSVPSKSPHINGVNGLTNGLHHDDDDDDADDEEESMPKKGGVCIKSNCPRHKNWAKSQLAEVRFEQDLVRRSLGKLEAQLYEFRQRAMVRAWERRG